MKDFTNEEMTKQDLYDLVKEILMEARNEASDIPDYMLCEGITFRNGLNGTDFDYLTNSHLPPFSLDYKEEYGDKGFIVADFYRYNKVVIYTYKMTPPEEGVDKYVSAGIEPCKEKIKWLPKKTVYKMFKILIANFDSKDIYNKTLEEVLLGQ